MRITIALDAVPQPRPRFGKGNVFQSARVKKFKAAIKSAAELAGFEPLEGDVICCLRFWRNFNPSSRRFGDCDNLFKAVADALNGVAYLDDSQIVACSIEKFRSDSPRVEIEIFSNERSDLID